MPKPDLAELDFVLDADASAIFREDADDLNADDPADPILEAAAKAEDYAPSGLLNPKTWGFRLTPKGVEYLERRPEMGEEPKWRRLCAPLAVVADTRDGDGRAWGRLVAFTDRDARRHELAIAAADLIKGAQGDVLTALADRGFEVPIAAASKTKLLTYLNEARPRARYTAADRVGWHGAAFVLPDRTIGDRPATRTIFQPEGAGFEHAYRTAGDLDTWSREVAEPCVGNSRLILALSTAFVGPLLALTGDEGGGVHLRGASSVGKSTALEVAASVWGGGGLRGFVSTWRATDNGLEGVAVKHCDTLLCLDEIGECDGRAAGAAAYMLANGTGKTRASRSGDARAAKTWRIVFLSTGEVGLSDKLAEDGRGRRARAGQEVRVLDVPADAGAGLGLFEVLHAASDAKSLADGLKAAARRSYGVAADAYLAFVVKDRDRATTFIKRTRDAILSEMLPAGAGGQVARAAQRFALIGAAGELARLAGVVPWPEGEAAHGAATCFKAWLAARGGAGAAEDRDIIDRLRAFMGAHASRFQSWTLETADVRDRVGFWRDNSGEREWFLLPDAFAAEVAAGLNARDAVRVLVRAGLIIPGDDGKPGSPHKPPAIGKTIKLYRLGPGVWEGSTDD